MKSITEYLTFNMPARMAFLNITPQLEQIVQKSGVKEGLLLCNAMHITASVFVNDDEPATSQMSEFAARTMQNGNPPLARDFIPAFIDQAAMPVRVEKWSLGGQVVYRVVGLIWGGDLK